MREFEGEEMKKGNTSRREYWFLVVAGTGLMLLTGAGAFWLKASADRSQPTLEMAVDENPAAPIHGVAWNNAVGDLLRSLPPDLAIEVCASLSNGAGRPAPQPCPELRQIAAIVPAASGAMAEAADGRISMPTINQLPAEMAASYAMAALPQSSPPGASMPEIGTESAVVPEPAPVTSKVAAAIGAQIAAAQTTQTGLKPAARDEMIESAPPSGPPQAQTPLAAAIIEDATIVHGLLLTADSQQTANESGGASAESPSKEAALAAAEAAKAQAQARARARAAAEAKAIAAARAKARAAARAKARENARASARGSREDNGDGGDSKADGNGRGGSSGEGGRD
jgi:colicin import membrane protein